MIKQYSAGIITYIKKDDEILYLLLHYLSGHWDFPKGKLEDNETAAQAAYRELQEETGLIADLIPGFEQSLDYTFQENNTLIKKKVTFFVGKTHHQKVILSREHIDYKWLDYQKAYTALTYKNAKDILAHAHRFIQKYENTLS
jgi:bis(5'-nucleosidyl)-tetraphosphatase